MVYLLINYNKMASLKYFVISFNSSSSPCIIMDAIIFADYLQPSRHDEDALLNGR